MKEAIMGRSTNSEKLELQCKFGTLVCEVVRNDEDYREFAIDLVRPNGRAYQVAVIGTNETDEYVIHDKVHIYCYDGDDAEDPACMLMSPDGNGYYCE